MVKYPNPGLDDDLHAQIQTAAKINHRSVKAEIVYRLEQSLQGNPPTTMSLVIASLRADLTEAEAEWKDMGRMTGDEQAEHRGYIDGLKRALSILGVAIAVEG